MQIGAIASSFICLAAAQLVAAEVTTSVSTTTITKTLIRVHSVSPTPSSSLATVAATSTPLTLPTSTHAAPSAVVKTGGAVSVNAATPAVVIAGSFALIMGLTL